MTQTIPLRKKFEHLRRSSGPRGWQSRAAAECGYSRGYMSKIARGLVDSPIAKAALNEWKRRNKVA